MSDPIQLDVSVVLAKMGARYERLVGQLMQENAQLEAFVAALTQQLTEAVAAAASPPEAGKSPDEFGDTSD